MADTDWQGLTTLAFMMFLNGDAIPEPDSRGRSVADDSFLLVFNPAGEDQAVVIPGERLGQRWRTEIDTGRQSPVLPEVTGSLPARGLGDAGHVHGAGSRLVVAHRSLVVLVRDDADVTTAPPPSSSARSMPQSRSFPAALMLTWPGTPYPSGLRSTAWG